MKKTVIITIVCIVALSVDAQGINEDFQTYRKRMLEGYQGFRKNILDDYERFLNGIWDEYAILAGRKKNIAPKPLIQPEKKVEETASPQIISPQEATLSVPIAKDIFAKRQNATPAIRTNTISYEWCGMTLQLPDANIHDNLIGVDKKNLVAYFEYLNNSRLKNDVLPQVEMIANRTNMNDWCLCLLIQSYVKIIKAEANESTRNMICWYMMTLCGFDIRLAFNGNRLFYMIPFQQRVFARNYIMIRDTPYYIYGEGKIEKNEGLSTPQIPDAEVGAKVNAVMLRPLNIPYHTKRFLHTFANKTLSVEVNENLVRVMAQFPQLSTPAYAITQGDTKARNQVLSQMKQFIVGMSEVEAANFLLQFVQSFDYATDDEQFGYEKPFYIEETLFYPKCDCEDRAVFYHFLVTNLLGCAVHLVHYPNHECNAVHFSQYLNADHYIYNGKQYVICDPTYIGASIGMCMPDFRNTKPEVELIKIK